MPIQATCQSCDETIRVATKHAGKRIRCPECGEPTRVPRSSAKADRPAAAPAPQAPPNRKMFVFGAAGGGAIALLIVLISAVVMSGERDPLADVDFAQLERDGAPRVANEVVSSTDGSDMHTLPAGKGDQSEEHDPTKGARGIKFAGGNRTPPPKMGPSTGKTAAAKPARRDPTNPDIGDTPELRQNFPEYEAETDAALKPIREKLARIGLAFRKLQFEKGDAAALGKDQKLSWLVHLLPYLDDPKAKELHAKFNLNEAWDSPNNWPLLSEIPATYQYAAKDKSATRFRFFEGTGLIFDKDRSLSPKQIADGIQHTLLAVTVAGNNAVPWTKPSGIEFVPSAPLGPIGTVYKDRIEAVICDAKPLSIPSFIPPKIFNALVTPRAGDFADGPSIRHGWGMFPDVQVPGPRLTKEELDQDHQQKLALIGAALRKKYENGKFVLHDANKSVLSWRVELLPYLGYGALYRQFNHKEPWFNPQNQKLLWKMPDVYRFGHGGETNVHIPTSDGSIFALRLAPHEITDGADKTILCYLGSRRVIWTDNSPFSSRRGEVPRFMLTVDLNIHPGSHKFKEMLTAQGGEEVSLETVKRVAIGNERKKEAAANRDIGKVYVGASVLSKTNSQYAATIAWHPQNSYFAVNSKNKVLFFDQSKGRTSRLQREVRVDPPDEVSSLGFSNDADQLVAGTTSGKLFVFKLKQDGSRVILSPYSTTIKSAALNTNGSLVASCAKGVPGGVVFDVATKTKRTLAGLESKYIQRLLFSPDGTRLYAGTLDGDVHVIDIASGKEALSFNAHNLGLSWMRLHADGSMLATGSMTQGELKVWDAQTGDKLMDSTTYLTGSHKSTMARIKDPVHSLGFYKDHDHVIMMAAEVGRVFRISTGKQVSTFKGARKDAALMGDNESPRGTWHVRAVRDAGVNIQARDRFNFEAHGVYTKKKKE